MNDKPGWPHWKYPLDIVPTWCKMPPYLHQDNIGGCWGLASGKVQEDKSHCDSCDFNENQVVRPEHVGDE